MTDTTISLKLSIDLVPVTARENSVRKNVSGGVWEEIQVECFKTYDNKCGLCGAGGKLACHEVWDYDDTTHTQRLNGFIALCQDCDNIKHIGIAQIRADKGEVDFGLLIEHFCAVNKCSREIFDVNYFQTFAMFMQRNAFSWRPDYGNYSYLIKK